MLSAPCKDLKLEHFTVAQVSKAITQLPDLYDHCIGAGKDGCLDPFPFPEKVLETMMEQKGLGKMSDQGSRQFLVESSGVYGEMSRGEERQLEDKLLQHGWLLKGVSIIYTS